MEQLDRAGRLTARRGAQAGRDLGIAQEGQARAGVPADRAGARHAREPLHRRVPLDHGEIGVHHGERGVEGIDDAPAHIVHRASMLRALTPMQ